MPGMKERQPDMGIVPPSGMDRARKAARQTQNHPPSRQSAAPFQLQPDAPRRGAENGQKIEAPYGHDPFDYLAEDAALA